MTVVLITIQYSGSGLMFVTYNVIIWLVSSSQKLLLRGQNGIVANFVIYDVGLINLIYQSDNIWQISMFNRWIYFPRM